MQFQPEIAPLGGSLLYSALLAMLPLIVVFVCLGVLKMKAHWSCLLGVAVSMAVAIAVYKMPAVMAVSSAFEGAAFGIFPITWIVLCAIFFFELTVASGHHDDLMKAFNVISPDPRVLGVLIGFAFCALLEALAGFGAPVAIVGIMLVAIGFKPMKAAVTVLVGNTYAVPFGAIATPILTGAKVAELNAVDVSVFVSRQTSLFVWLVPLLLLVIMDGVRGLKQVWPLALVVGVSYSAGTWFTAGLSPELTNMVASLFSLAIGVAFLRIWKPQGSDQAALDLTGKTVDLAEAKASITTSKVMWSLFPYIFVIVVFSVTQLVPVVKKALAATNIKIQWPGLWADGQPLLLSSAGEPQTSTITYTFPWLSSPGTLLLISGVIVGLIFRMKIGDIWKVFTTQVYKLRWTFLTIGAVLALAYEMNLSGETLTIGYWLAGAGVVFPFVSPILGYIGTAVTGSGTSTMALFASLQQTAANQIGVNANLLVAANVVGGAVGKMIAPQTLAIAATAVDGKEADMLRKSMPWSVVLLIALCIVVGLMAMPVLGWILPA